MTPAQIDLLNQSWSALESNRMALAMAFYGRLFEVAPELKDMFVLVEMESQSAKFLAMIHEILRAVQDPEAFADILRASGRRHRGYGVMAKHYRTVGEAFVWALAKTAGDGFDRATRDAWAEAYTRMAQLMKAGAAAN